MSAELGNDRSLSPMEHTVLGIVWQSGPITTYAIMGQMRASGSTYYRDSAGTTYPIARRLEQAGLICDSGMDSGTRKERLLEITESGREALRGWLSTPVPMSEIAFMRDLLRLRVFFLGALPTDLRAAILHEARNTLEEHLLVCESGVLAAQNRDDPFISLASLGAVYETKARIAWLDEITPRILGQDEGSVPLPSGVLRPSGA